MTMVFAAEDLRQPKFDLAEKIIPICLPEKQQALPPVRNIGEKSLGVSVGGLHRFQRHVQNPSAFGATNGGGP
ncbi:hypothetical protein J4E08_23905 [Sagittula sp. NFXS13]|uniref:hypothetical protein n=1 Tax=Sagittula sp. NFXS13 TaxID=2819095 RepID=UPI0032DE2F34